MPDAAGPTPQQSRQFGRILILFGVVEVVGIIGLSFWIQEPWMPYLALASVPTFFWGWRELSKANDAEEPH